MYLFHLFGIHVLSELSFPLFPIISSRMHIDPEIYVSLVRGTSETLFFEIRAYYIFFHCSGFYSLRKKNSFTCFCYKWCVKFSFGSWGIKLYWFHLFGIHLLSEFLCPEYLGIGLSCVLICLAFLAGSWESIFLKLFW